MSEFRLILTVEGYQFRLKQSEQDKAVIILNVMKTTGDVNGDDIKWVKSYLEDIGKWETATKGVADFLVDVGITVNPTITAEKYGKWRYYIGDILKPAGFTDNQLEVGIGLSSQEYIIRQELPIVEIESQLKNIQKWRILQKYISLFCQSTNV
jgi:hypothetical protein